MAPEKFKALRHGCMASGPGVGAHKIKLLCLKHQSGVGASEDEKQGFLADPTGWCLSSLAKLVNISPISLWFIGDISIVNVIITHL